MIHFKDFTYFVDQADVRLEFEQIFIEKTYQWKGCLGKHGDFFGVTDDPLNPTWGVFGKMIFNHPDSRLYGHQIFQIKLSYGKIDLNSLFNNLEGFDFILTNKFCLTIPNSIPVDWFESCYALNCTTTETLHSKFQRRT